MRFFPEAAIGNRKCSCFQVRPKVRRHDTSKLVKQFFVDAELQVLVRYASYVWPRSATGRPRLEQECAYTHVRLYVGLTDDDFRVDNPRYRFVADRLRAEEAGGR